jgi:hypothetical protein
MNVHLCTPAAIRENVTEVILNISQENDKSIISFRIFVRKQNEVFIIGSSVLE